MPQDLQFFTVGARELKLFGLTRGRIAVLAILTLAAALMEGFGMAMLLPLLEYIEKGQSIKDLSLDSQMWRYIARAHEVLGLTVGLVSLVLTAIGTMLLRVVVMYARQLYSVWLSQGIQHAIRSNLFSAYMAMDYGAFSRLSSGSLINTLTTETQRATGSFSALFAMIANLVVVLGFVSVLFWISVPLTVLAIACLGAAASIVAYYVRYTKAHSQSVSAANDSYSRIVLERIGGFRLVKLSAASERETANARRASRELRDHIFLLSSIGARIDLIMEPLVLISGGALVFFAVGIFSMGLSELGVFGMILLRLLPLAKEVMRSHQTWSACAGSLKSVVDGYAVASASVEPRGGEVPFLGLRSSIVLSRVCFSYPDALKPALSDVTIEIPAGKTTAFVGPSGSGKTTLADVVARLRIPQTGSVRYDGVEAAEFEIPSLRRSIAFVSQDSLILDDTVASNLHFVCPEATDVALWSALERAQAADFVRGLDHGLQTRLGDRGIRLSGGQRQRIALARALLVKASILILDEPTSALDTETEHHIRKALADLRAGGKVTLIIIAHRLATIRDADQIVLLRDGSVVGQGTHRELIISEEWYANVSGIQAGTVR